MGSLYLKEDLEQLIKEVIGIQTITPMIENQINRFVIEYKMTYKEIARCIVWFTEVAGESFDTMYGLGMVPNIREDAEKYFKQLELDQQRQAEQAKKVVEYQDNNIIFHIKNLEHRKRKPKGFDIAEISVEPEATDSEEVRRKGVGQ